MDGRADYERSTRQEESSENVKEQASVKEPATLDAKVENA